MITVAERLAQPAETARRSPSQGWRRWAMAAGVPTVLTAAHAAYYRFWIVDDAGLSFAYARSLATGAGPVLQAGADPVEGYSNPTWVAVLAGGRWLGLFDRGAWFGIPDVVLFPKLVALLCCLGIFAAMFAIASAVARHPVLVTIAAGSVTAAIPSFVIWTTSGLENALFALAVMVLAVVLARAAASGRLLDVDTALGAGGLAALAALTRPDGAIYVLAFPLAVALAMRRDDLRRSVKACAVGLVAFAVPIATYLGWRLVTFGDYLPNPARAKEQGLPTLTDLNKPAALIGYAGWLAVLLGIALVAVTLWRPSSTRTVVVALLVPLGLAVTSFAFLQADWMAQYRFATPVWPLAAIVVAVAAAHVLQHSTTRTRVIAAALGTVAAISSVAGYAAAENAFRIAPTTSICDIAQNTGYTFNGYADVLGIRDGSLLAVDGGGTSLTSRLRFVDLSGLADRRIARFWQDDDMTGLRNHIFDDLRPTFIKMFPGWSERDRLALVEDPRMARDYVLLRSGVPGSGHWVRRDALSDRGSLAAARQWGREVSTLVESRYWNLPAPIWPCGDTLRPTQFRNGSPASSPITES